MTANKLIQADSDCGRGSWRLDTKGERWGGRGNGDRQGRTALRRSLLGLGKVLEVCIVYAQRWERVVSVRPF